jgi:hypothetical protein
MNKNAARRAFLAALSGLLAAFVSEPAIGQAWLPPKGEAWLSLGYGNTFSTKHYLGVADPDGTTTTDAGHTRMQSAGLTLGYGITDRFAAAVGIPFVAGKYMGTNPHQSNGVISTGDNGFYHGTFQDYRFNLSYRLFDGAAAVAPYFTAVIPSHSYSYFSHAAPGRDLREFHLGVAAGSRLDQILPGSYVQATYAYAFVERVEVVDVSLNRSYFDLQVGYFLTPSLSMRFMGVGFYTHGGLVFRTPKALPPELYPYHDQIGKASSVEVGGGLSYALTGSTEVSVSYLRNAYGRGTHKVDQGLGFSVGYSFSPAQLIRRYSQSNASPSSGEAR